MSAGKQAALAHNFHYHPHFRARVQGACVSRGSLAPHLKRINNGERFKLREIQVEESEDSRRASVTQKAAHAADAAQHPLSRLIHALHRHSDWSKAEI